LTDGITSGSVGIIDGHNIVQTPEGFEKTEGPELSSGAILSNKKNVRDEIKIEKL
jgi:hypothetical protein